VTTIPDIKAQVTARYAEAARQARGGRASCCGPACCTTTATPTDPISRDLYDAVEVGQLPDTAVLASLGCGNPTALAELRPGEVVLDLGSGGGIDVLLSAKRVGPTGKAYGLDLTDEMLALARENQRKAGATNLEFLKGDIEHIPLPDASVDVIISNCVINLAADKGAVLREAFRVLRPGGRFAVSDIVLSRPLPEAVRQSVALWTGCVAGALTEAEYLGELAAAGFVGAGVEPTRVFGHEDARAILGELDPDTERHAREVDGVVRSAFIRATRPPR
jgi:SAM-dependent methyltransferase